jgi:hypothetical protein
MDCWILNSRETIFYILIFIFMTNFETALATGKALIRKVWVNEGSTKNQLGIQLVQQIQNNSEAVNPSLLLQGIKNTQKLTVVISAKQDVALSGGVKIQDYIEQDEVLFAEDLYAKLAGAPVEVNIQCTENNSPYRMNGSIIARNAAGEPLTIDAKINPSTGEIVMANGKEVYRHTSLVFGKPSHTFLRAESTSVETLGLQEA